MTAFRELEGKRFSELGDLRAELEATTIRCIVLRKSNSKPIVREIFSRLNQGAVSLSDQEIRHALFPGAFDDLLAELAQLPAIANFGRGPASTVEKDSREGEQQVLRYFAFRGSLDGYDGRRLGKFLDEVMESKAGATAEQIDVLRKDFKTSLERCFDVFGDEAFIDTSASSTSTAMHCSGESRGPRTQLPAASQFAASVTAIAVPKRHLPFVARCARTSCLNSAGTVNTTWKYGTGSNAARCRSTQSRARSVPHRAQARLRHE
jgi:hypothetical protein